jgi:hypothetical protein
MASDTDFSKVLPLPQAAALAGVTERWMRFLVTSGAVKGTRVGRFWLVDKESAEKFQRHPTAGRPRKDAKR